MANQYGLEEFIEEVRSALSKHLSAGDTLRSVTPGFKKLLDNRSFLQEKLNELDTVRDEVLLYKDPDHRFSILARGVSREVKRQGQSHAGTPHDHGSLWALYGLYEGTARFQRYRVDPTNKNGPFPGLQLISDEPAKAGDFDAIEPGNMHLPIFPSEGGGVIIVVYDGALETVVRRGYLRDIQQPVIFKGLFASSETRVDQPQSS